MHSLAIDLLFGKKYRKNLVPKIYRINQHVLLIEYFFTFRKSRKQKKSHNHERK